MFAKSKFIRGGQGGRTFCWQRKVQCWLVFTFQENMIPIILLKDPSVLKNNLRQVWFQIWSSSTYRGISQNWFFFLISSIVSLWTIWPPISITCLNPKKINSKILCKNLSTLWFKTLIIFSQTNMMSNQTNRLTLDTSTHS
jgi:hypothetical protein